MNAIEIKNVTKKFKDLNALQDVTITFEHGKIYGLLGRNGAGKSTLLNIITNRLFPSYGEVFVDGATAIESDETLHKIFLMSEVSMYPKGFRVKDVFHYTKQFYDAFDLEYAYALCEEFKLDPKKRIAKLSTGYTSIYKLITALSIDVPYVFFDEPVLGLDANHRDLFYKLMLERYAQVQNTYVISTHLIEEIASIIEEIVILKDGCVLQQKSCEALLKQGYQISGKANEVDAYVKGKNILNTEQLGQLKTAYIMDSQIPNDIPSSLEINRLDLQKLFVQLTNERKEQA